MCELRKKTGWVSFHCAFYFNGTSFPVRSGPIDRIYPLDRLNRVCVRTRSRRLRSVSVVGRLLRLQLLRRQRRTRQVRHLTLLSVMERPRQS
jgi:hypothetical protein